MILALLNEPAISRSQAVDNYPISLIRFAQAVDVDL